LSIPQTETSETMLEDEGGAERVAAPEGSEDDGRSLFADIETLIDDGRTFVEAEIAFQKTRMAYTGQKGRNAAIFGVCAAIFGVFALFGLIVGLIIALSPLLTAWGATAVIVGILLAAALICAMIALRNVQKIRAAFRKDQE